MTKNIIKRDEFVEKKFFKSFKEYITLNYR